MSRKQNRNGGGVATLDNGKAAIVLGAALGAIGGAVEQTATPTPATIANASGEEQAAALKAAIGGAYCGVAAAALKETNGRAEIAAGLVGDSVRPTVALIARIVPILRSPAPAACFTDGNNRGARVGDLWASKLGLSAAYRDTSRADLKAARAALREGF